ncbi:GTPase ObgE [Aeromicrobium sp.]|nr:GTPase ObgE [Candidatus Saccharibacteria bacterium]
MHFIDNVLIDVIAGDGGDGKLSWRHEKFIDKGGPDGGDAGHGGDVILAASRNENTLAVFRYQKEVKAQPGKPGGKSKMHGRSAPDLVVSVPVGTVVTLDGEIVADLIVDGQQAVIAKGGKGGFGNAHFLSSTRQAPNFAEKGEKGERFNLKLEIKMIADVGLVGQPNAGKSTLLSRISNARPEIADYPFTTITPNLGVVDIDKGSSVLMADIPGLIEGAADGKGLGHDFLKHVERTAVILHLVDAYQDDVAAAYTTIKQELKAYQPALAKRPEIVVLTKIEGLDAEIVADLLTQLRTVVPARTKLLAISSQSGAGLTDMLFAVKKAVTTARAKVEKEVIEQAGVPVLKLTDTSQQWTVTKVEDGFKVTGFRIEKFAGRTDFDNEQGIRRLRDIMKKMGIMHDLIRKNIAVGENIHIGPDVFEY